MKVTVYEVHPKNILSYAYIEDYKSGNVWHKNDDLLYTIEKSKVYEVDGKIVVKMEIDIGNSNKLEFIKIASADFSNAFIIITPTEEQDIIIDLTLDPNIYFNIINPK